MIIVLSLLFMSISIPAAALEPVSAASTNINSTMTNSEIQNVLDNAASGDTINFLGQIYTNIQLTINKTLNIVTHVGTVLSGPSSSESAVFLINGSKASGTQISGFNITGSGSGILVNSTSNVNISKCNISASNGSAVTINKSSGTNIKKSNITNSITGINISNSKNTKITGSIVKNSQKDGIDVENSASTTINSTQITGNSGKGVKICNSNNTVVNGSTLRYNGDNNKAGESSDEGGVSVKNSNGVKITHNTINDNSQGVTVADSSNVVITNNTVNNNYGEGILLNGALLENVSVNGNDIEKNGNGIVLNYHNGINIHIHGNIITESMRNSLQDEDSGSGMRFGSNYASNSETEVIEHNAIFNNRGMDLIGKDAQVSRPNVGSNWYGYSPRLCGCVNYTKVMYLQGIQIGADTYVGGFYDGVTGQVAADFPSLMVKLTGNGISLSTMSQNGQAIFQIDPNLSSGMLTLTSTMVNINGNWVHSTSQPSNNGTDPNKPGEGNGNGSGTGNGGANGNNGNGFSSGTTSGTSVSVGQAAASAASGDAGNSGQSGSNSKKSKTAHELFIENTVKDPTVWSIIGIIVLLVLIFGVYYRNELMSMIKKSKK
jgi:parallel beta-helix repeat protein